MASTEAPSAEALLDSSLSKFRIRLSAQECTAFTGVTAYDVKLLILKIQTDQGRLRTLKDPSRITGFIQAFDQFIDVCTALKLGGSDVSSFLWGPVRFILQVG